MIKRFSLWIILVLRKFYKNNQEGIVEANPPECFNLAIPSQQPSRLISSISLK